MDELLWLTQQIADADYSPLVSKFAKAVMAEGESLEIGLRMATVSRMAWLQAGGDLFEVTALDGTFAIGPTLLEALRNLADAPDSEG